MTSIASTLLAPLGRAVRRNRTIAWAYGAAKYRRRVDHQGRPLVVYQMGKVGSTAVYRALEVMRPSYSVYHVHSLQPDEVRTSQAAYRQNFRTRPMVPLHLFASRILMTELATGQARGRWKVISIVRDPIARNISSFFQDVEVRHPTFGFGKRLREQPPADMAADLIELFWQRHDHREPLLWCDRELKGVLGIDVFDTAFPTNKGWQGFESDLAELVVFRLEDLNSAWPEGIGAMLGGAAPSLPVENAAIDKSYASIYSEFKKRLCVSQDYIDDMYGSRFARHFYNADELKHFADRWLKSS